MGKFSERLLKSVGESYGELTIIEPYYNEGKGKNSYRYVKTICSCGTQKVVRVDSLWRGDTKSCGCSKGVSCGVKFPVKRVTDHPLYSVWTDMNRRCYTKTRKDFEYYGGRGITVCSEWNRYNKKGFVNFLCDMESTFKVGLELERLDTNRGYDPSNCIWSDRKTQVNNTRVNHLIQGYGLSLSIEEWNHLLNLEKGLLWDRVVYLGWDSDMESLLSVQFKDRAWRFEYEGKIYNASELWELLGYSYGKRCYLVNKAGNSEEALRAQGINFTTIKPREKDYRNFQEGINLLEISDSPYDRQLLTKINNQRRNNDK